MQPLQRLRNLTLENSVQAVGVFKAYLVSNFENFRLCQINDKYNEEEEPEPEPEPLPLNSAEKEIGWVEGLLPE